MLRSFLRKHVFNIYISLGKKYLKVTVISPVTVHLYLREIKLTTNAKKEK